MASDASNKHAVMLPEVVIWIIYKQGQPSKQECADRQGNRWNASTEASF
jgi:hypothetical protein